MRTSLHICFFALCPEVNANVLNFVSRQRTITTSEIVEYVGCNSSLTVLSTISSLLAVILAAQTAMRGSKPHTKRFNSCKGRTCYVCGQKHILSQCPKSKGLVPDAPIFRMNGNKSKNAAWVGCQEFTSDSTVHGSSDF